MLSKLKDKGEKEAQVRKLYILGEVDLKGRPIKEKKGKSYTELAYISLEVVAGAIAWAIVKAWNTRILPRDDSDNEDEDGWYGDTMDHLALARDKDGNIINNAGVRNLAELSAAEREMLLQYTGTEEVTKNLDENNRKIVSGGFDMTSLMKKAKENVAMATIEYDPTTGEKVDRSRLKFDEDQARLNVGGGLLESKEEG